MRKEDKRRGFTALFAAVMALSAFAAPRLAFQVYAVRELCEKDFVGTLKAAKAKGLKTGDAGVGSSRDKADWERIVPALAADGVEWLVVKPTAHPGSLDDLKSSIKYLKGILK